MEAEHEQGMQRPARIPNKLDSFLRKNPEWNAPILPCGETGPSAPVPVQVRAGGTLMLGKAGWPAQEAPVCPDHVSPHQLVGWLGGWWPKPSWAGQSVA